MTDEATVFHIRPLHDKDRNWVAHFMDEHWRSTKLVSRGRVFYGHLLPGFAAFRCAADQNHGKAIGLLTYHVENQCCEVLTLDSLEEGIGVGSALIDAVKTAALHNGIKRLWLITTNDNLYALRFYQKRGFRIGHIHHNAIEEARKLKPQIPILGFHSIPIRDEIELYVNL